MAGAQQYSYVSVIAWTQDYSKLNTVTEPMTIFSCRILHGIFVGLVLESCIAAACLWFSRSVLEIGRQTAHKTSTSVSPGRARCRGTAAAGSGAERTPLPGWQRSQRQRRLTLRPALWPPCRGTCTPAHHFTHIAIFCQPDEGQGLPNVFIQLYIVLDPRYPFVSAFVSRPGGVTESLVNIEVWMAARTRGAIQSNNKRAHAQICLSILIKSFCGARAWLAARTREHCRQVTTAHRLTS